MDTFSALVDRYRATWHEHQSAAPGSPEQREITRELEAMAQEIRLVAGYDVAEAHILLAAGEPVENLPNEPLGAGATHALEEGLTARDGEPSRAARAVGSTSPGRSLAMLVSAASAGVLAAVAAAIVVYNATVGFGGSGSNSADERLGGLGLSSQAQTMLTGWARDLTLDTPSLRRIAEQPGFHVEPQHSLTTSPGSVPGVDEPWLHIVGYTVLHVGTGPEATAVAQDGWACGVHATDSLTLCNENAADDTGGAYYAGVVTLGGTVPLQQTRYDITIALAIDRDGDSSNNWRAGDATAHNYLVNADFAQEIVWRAAAGTWSSNAVGTDGRSPMALIGTGALIRIVGDHVIFIVPDRLFSAVPPGFRFAIWSALSGQADTTAGDVSGGDVTAPLRADVVDLTMP